MTADERFHDTAMPPFPWQQPAWQRLCEQFHASRLPHAFLVHGVPGVGALEYAAAAARYLLCHAPLEDVACGRCRGCSLLKAGSHPDIFRLRAEEDATQIKVDQVRECVEFVARTAHFDLRKVVIVEHADAMNINASNALLKSLEEPGADTVFILVTQRLSAILPTIRSRCQSVALQVPPLDEAQRWLQEQGLDQDKQGLLAQAGGAPLLVRQWVQDDFPARQATLFEQLSHLLEGRVEGLRVAQDWQKQSMDELLQNLLFALDALIRDKLSHAGTAPPETRALAQSASGLSVQLLFKLRDRLVVKMQQWRRNSNLNPAMFTEELALDWQALSRRSARA